jgi:hypothetical protein
VRVIGELDGGAASHAGGLLLASFGAGTASRTPPRRSAWPAWMLLADCLVGFRRATSLCFPLPRGRREGLGPGRAVGALGLHGWCHHRVRASEPEP